MGYDPRYFPSERTAFGDRLKDSLQQMYLSRTDTGSWRIAYPRIIADFGSGFVSRAWHPEGERGWQSALSSGAISLGADAAMNDLKEFIRLAR
jgi:hypothetical protein